MQHAWHRLWHWTLHQAWAQGPRWLHSPRVFGLHQHVLAQRKNCPPAVVAYRQHLLRDNTRVEISDHGAVGGGNTRTLRVKDVARRAGSPLPKAAFLYHLVRWLAPTTALELGTNLGIGTLAHALALPPRATLHTVDAAATLQAYAQAMGAAHGLENQLRFYTKTFDQFFSNSEPPAALDYVFVDGDHTETSTQRYTDALLPQLNPGAVVVFDDIYWSPGMTRAWQWVEAHPAFPVTVDLYWLGLAWFGVAQAPQQFRLRSW